jgi:hypothetical protein
MDMDLECVCERLCVVLDEIGYRSFLVIHLLMEIGVDRY